MGQPTPKLQAPYHRYGVAWIRQCLAAATYVRRRAQTPTKDAPPQLPRRTAPPFAQSGLEVHMHLVRDGLRRTAYRSRPILEHSESRIPLLQASRTVQRGLTREI